MSTPKAVANWSRARDLCPKGHYKEALNLLQNIEWMLAGRDAEYHVFRGFVHYKVGNYEHAIDDARMAMQLIPEERRQYNDEEKKYLYSHAQITLARALQDEGKKSESDMALLQCDLPSIRLDRVRKLIKLNYPLRTHPDWKQNMGETEARQKFRGHNT